MKLARTTARKFLLGVEIIPEAVEDAKTNANDNELSADWCVLNGFFFKLGNCISSFFCTVITSVSPVLVFVRSYEEKKR